MLAESSKHFKVAVGQGVRYTCFRENWVRFGAVELSFGVSVANSYIWHTHGIKLGKTLHDLIKKFILRHEKANPVWARQKGREEIAPQSHPSKISLPTTPSGSAKNEKPHAELTCLRGRSEKRCENG